MRTTRMVGLAAGSMFALSTAAFGAGMDYSQYSTVDQQGDGLAQSAESVSGDRLLDEGNVVSASGNLEGEVMDVAFDRDGEASFVTYSFSETPASTATESYVPFEAAEIFATATDVEVHLPADEDEGSIADRRITEEEADARLLSRILDSDLTIGGEEYAVEDVLLTQDGRVEMALIDADRDTATPEQLAVPMDHLQLDAEGRLVSPTDITPDLLIIQLG